MFHFRLSSLFFFGLLLAASFAFTGCDENCDDCQAAIDHMYEKMPANLCNPATMANAVDRINKNCNKEGQNATYIINCAVENCAGLSAAPPFCESPGVGIPFLVDISFSSFGNPVVEAELVLKLRRNDETVEQVSIMTGPGRNHFFGDWQYNDGDEMTVQLYDTQPVPEALTPVASFDMLVRSAAEARVYRAMTLGHNPTANEYTIEARNF